MSQASVFSCSLLFGTGLMLVGCGDNAPPAPPAAAPAVTVVRVMTADIRPSSSFTGRVQAKDKVDLRARVDGFLEKRLFEEGADVNEGDLLFVIEKGLYQAAVEEAEGGLSRAQSALTLADIELDRQNQLFEKKISAKATLDQAIAKQAEARGAMLSQSAALDRAKLQLGYTDIRAPIAGRIGRASVSVGSFVGPASGALATIVTQNPAYVSFPVTQREILALRKARVDNGGDDSDGVVIHIQLADGSRYPSPGKFNFLDVTVNQGTDTVQVRAIFPNPDRILVDGQLVSVVAEAGKAENALLIPQQALQADQIGTFVLIVDGDNKVQVRRIEAGASRGTWVIVRKGLNADDRVITEGIQRIRPGQVVQATEATPGA